MEQITKKNCLEIIKEKFPKIIPYLEKAMAYWEEDWLDAGIFNNIRPFEDYATDAMKKNDVDEVAKIFAFVEFLICNSDEEIQTVMTTGFWETILHRDPHKIQLKGFVQYMGKESIAYCRAWDAFTGVKTNGLWDDERKFKIINKR